MRKTFERFRHRGQEKMEFGLILAFVSISLGGVLLAIYLLDADLFRSIIGFFTGHD